MIQCPQCHHECADEAHFCGNCAAPLKPKDEKETVKPACANADDDFVGKCIDNKYYIEKKLAAGGMGVVYLARQKGVGQEVAVKKLHASLYSDKTIVERFIDEARSYGRITHPNAVKLHDLLNVNGQICIIMEFVHGKTLTQYIEERYPFTMRQIIDISLQIADALGTVHQAGIIHRDLKTENIMLMETVSGRFSVKILDFGIAKMMDKPACRHTQEGVLVGTPEFMSPEQCFGNPVDHRADIYSFGILLYVMVCSRLPFMADRALALLQMHIHNPVPPITLLDGTPAPPNIEAIILKCMEKAPENRYQCFADVITDLTCCQEGRPTTIAVTSEHKSEDKTSCEKHSIPTTMLGTATAPTDEIAQADEEAISTPTIQTSPEQPRHSAEFALYLDEERDVKFSLDDGEMELSETLIDTDNPESDDDDDGFCLGDIQGLDCSLAELEPVRDRGGKSGAVVLTIGLIVLAAAIVCGVIFIKPQSPEPAPMPQAFEPKDGIIPVENPTETADNPVAETPTHIPEPAPVIEPAAPSEVASREILARGVQRTLLANAQTLLQAGKTKDAQSMLSFMTEQKSIMMEAELTQFNTLTEQQQKFDTILAQAKKSSAQENCDAISKSVQEIPEDATGMRAQLENMASKCKQKLAAPPTML